MSLFEPRGPDDLHHLAAAYALDALDADERRRFEAHYPTCAICTQEVAEFRETAANLAEAAAVAPPPDLKARVLAEVGRTQQLPPIVPERVIDLAERRNRRRGWAMAVVAGAAAGLVALLGSAALFWSDSRPDDFTELVAHPDSVITTLDGEDGTLRVVWSPSLDRVGVIGEDLADPGPGRTYELWFLLDDGVAPAALFEPDSDGSIRRIIDVDDIDGGGFGVTIEPDGGSPQPTSDVLYAGEF